MEVTEDKPRETEEKPKPSPLDDYKFHVDTGGAIRGTSRARTRSRESAMDNEQRTREQLAKHAQRMRRIGCTLGEIARALEITIHETKRLLKEAAQ